jgi:hypothetical protein
MDRTLAGMGLKLEDVGGARRIGGLDQDRISADLWDAGVPAQQCVWLSLISLGTFDRVLLARDHRSEKYEGVLLVQFRSVGDVPFVVVEALCGGSAQRRAALLKRMLAYLILRLDTLEERPVAMLARTRNPILCQVMRDIAQGISGAGFYPEREGSVIPLATAGLAHRMARLTGPDCRFTEARMALDERVVALSSDSPLLAVVDLRRVAEADLEDNARQLFLDRHLRTAGKRIMADVLPLPKARKAKAPRVLPVIAAHAIGIVQGLPSFSL